ncbi:MAG: glucokinase, partial [Acidobacteria bacterium]
MILAGDIGGTNARLALFDVRNGQFNLVTATIFPSRNYSGLDQIVTEFVTTSGVHPAQACFGVAGPVTNGEVETSNLPWKIQSRRLADELKINTALLINDLEATGWGVGALSADDLVALTQISSTTGNQALIAAGTGLGEGGLYWDGSRHHVFASEGGHC